MQVEELSNRRILVLGLGREGYSSCKFLKQTFPNMQFAVADKLPEADLNSELRNWLNADRSIGTHLGPAYLDSISDYDIILRSPGISLRLPQLQHAAAKGVRFSSQSDIFLGAFQTPQYGRVIGITGTKGKSTTSSLLHHILSTSESTTVRNPILVGNIGIPFLEYLAPEYAGDRTFVAEFSSFQLEGVTNSPNVSVLLNIFAEHLNYHETFQEYVAAKANVTRYQTESDQLIYCYDSEAARAVADQSKARLIPFSTTQTVTGGAFLAEGFICSGIGTGSTGTTPKRVCPVDHCSALPGRFNLNNILAAFCAASVSGVSEAEFVNALKSYQPLEHRFEEVGTYSGITFFNASLATIPEATIAHLETLGDRVETVLLGGYDRELDFSELGKVLAARRIKNLILFPSTGRRIWDAVTKAGGERHCKPFFIDSMKSAVAVAYQETSPGSIVLHSPASPSFGMFKDYRERGTLFKNCVRESIAKESSELS